MRLVGISISGFEQDCISAQLSLFDQAEIFDKAFNASQKEEKLEKAIDSIRSRLGTNSVSRAVQIKKPK